MSRELLERALRALNNPQDCGYFGALIDDIKSELAKPESEPVADMNRLSDDEILKLKNPSMFVSSALSFARAIESALLEKNAQNKAVIKLEPSSEDLMNFSKYPKCNRRLIAEGKPNPRTCSECGLGPCKAVLMEKNK